MAIQATKSTKAESTGFQKSVGINEFTVVAVNPTRSQLNKILGIEDTDEQQEKEYLSDKEGVSQVKLEFWLKDSNGNHTPVTYTVKNAPSVSKADKPQFMNKMGDSSYAEGEMFLAEWFTNESKWTVKNGGLRKAFIGEAKLYEFLRAWQNRIEFDKVTKKPKIDEFSIDLKPVFKGNFKELQAMVGSELAGSVIMCQEVRVVDKEGEVKEYQGVYPYAVMPGYRAKIVKNAIGTGKWDTKALVNFKESIERSSNFYSNTGDLHWSQPYQPGANLATKSTEIATDDSSY